MLPASDVSASIDAVRTSAEGALDAARRTMAETLAAGAALRKLDNKAGMIASAAAIVTGAADAGTLALRAVLEASQAEHGRLTGAASGVMTLAEQTAQTTDMIAAFAHETAPELTAGDPAAQAEVQAFFDRLGAA